MTRILRVFVLLVVVLTLIMGSTGSASAGTKDGQRGSVTVEKGPQFVPGVSHEVVPAGSQPIESFPKFIEQIFNIAVFFFWLNLGYGFKT